MSKRYRASYNFYSVRDNKIVKNKITEIIEAKNIGEARKKLMFHPVGVIDIKRIKNKEGL